MRKLSRVRLFHCGDKDACDRESGSKSERGVKDEGERNLASV